MGRSIWRAKFGRGRRMIVVGGEHHCIERKCLTLNFWAEAVVVLLSLYLLAKCLTLNFWRFYYSLYLPEMFNVKLFWQAN